MIKLLICIIFIIKFSITVQISEKIQYYTNLIQTNLEAIKSYKRPTNSTEFWDLSGTSNITVSGHYDFIIVGAGTAGSVIARRLSEMKSWKMLVVEAGGEETEFSNIPASTTVLSSSRFAWQYSSIPQNTCCLAMENHQCSYSLGKVIGGSSAINGMGYIRGNHRAYDQWENMGNPGWSFQQVLPYFKKSEKNHIPSLDPEYHGKTGLFDINYTKPKSKFHDIFFDSLKQMGLRIVDYNGATQMGFNSLQQNIRFGQRCSAAKAFLTNVANNNVFIKTFGFVKKLLVHESNKTVYGVEYMKQGVKHTATVSKEVILSAGAVNSPQILMLSGIGPKDDLKKLGIKVVEDLPVGHNFQDAAVVDLQFQTNYSIPRFELENLIQDFLRGEGGLTRSAPIITVGFIGTLEENGSYPDVELYMISPQNEGASFNLNKTKLLKEDNALRKPDTDISIQITVLHPKSKGSITLKSKSPIDFPNIDLNLFSDPEDEDLNTLYRGIEFVLKLIKTDPFRKINAKLNMQSICQEHPAYSKTFWFCVIKKLGGPRMQARGTTRMGPKGHNSVVDHTLRVHGIKGLRVADCGVIPASTSGHTMAAALMIGEKVSDMIKNDYV